MSERRSESFNGSRYEICRFDPAEQARIAASLDRVASALERIDKRWEERIEKSIPIKTHLLILLSTIGILAGSHVIAALLKVAP